MTKDNPMPKKPAKAKRGDIIVVRWFDAPDNKWLVLGTEDGEYVCVACGAKKSRFVDTHYDLIEKRQVVRVVRSIKEFAE